MAVDGGGWQSVGWGEKDMPIPAGAHELTFKVPFYWFLPVSTAAVSITTPAGGTSTVHYRMSWIAFPGIKGKATAS